VYRKGLYTPLALGNNYPPNVNLIVAGKAYEDFDYTIVIA